jgi:hypothetical protein
LAFERSDVRRRSAIADMGRAMIFISLLMLSACQIGTKTAISYVNGIPVFSVTREDGGETCLDYIGLSEGTRDIEGPAVWALNQNLEDRQAGTAKCYNVFTYGKTVEGYEQRFFGRRSLIPGKSYVVDIGGGGLTGTTVFIYQPDQPAAIEGQAQRSKNEIAP